MPGAIAHPIGEAGKKTGAGTPPGRQSEFPYKFYLLALIRGFSLRISGPSDFGGGFLPGNLFGLEKLAAADGENRVRP